MYETVNLPDTRVGAPWGVAITRSSLCQHCHQPIFYSPRANQWWHVGSGAMDCMVMAGVTDAGPLVAAINGKRAEPKKLGVGAGEFWVEETGQRKMETRTGSDGVQRDFEVRELHTAPVLQVDPRTGKMIEVQPKVRVINGAVVMDG